MDENMSIGPDGRPRSKGVNDLLDSLLARGTIGFGTIFGATHGYNCTCAICHSYWLSVGPEGAKLDDDGDPIPGTGVYGPFGPAENFEDLNSYEAWLVWAQTGEAQDLGIEICYDGGSDD